jgi:hypothetical protein
MSKTLVDGLSVALLHVVEGYIGSNRDLVGVVTRVLEFLLHFKALALSNQEGCL